MIFLKACLSKESGLLQSAMGTYQVTKAINDHVNHIIQQPHDRIRG